MDYLDLEIKIDLIGGQKYKIEADSRNHVGVDTEESIFYFDYDELKEILLSLQEILYKIETGTSRRIGPRKNSATRKKWTLTDVENLGKSLFSFLFKGETLANFRGVQLLASVKNKTQPTGVRIRLNISERAKVLMSIPWEILYDPKVDDFICLKYQTTIVRYIDLPIRIEPIRVPKPLRILLMASDPFGDLEVNLEIKRIRESLNDLQIEGEVKLEVLEGGTLSELQDALSKEIYHIFHYVGHADFDISSKKGHFLFEEDKNQTKKVSAKQLTRLDLRKIRLVIINACNSARGSDEEIFSSLATKIIQDGIPAVIGMQYPVRDNIAIKFSKKFYQNIALGNPIDYSVADSRVDISLHNPDTLEWGNPVLYMRSEDGILFKISETSSSHNFRNDESSLEDLLDDAVRAFKDGVHNLLIPPDNLKPYKFVKSYEQTDWPIFKGRDNAITKLNAALLKSNEPITIMYAPSGAGKTSLIQAGLIPRLVREGYLPILARSNLDPVREIKNAIAPSLLKDMPEFVGAMGLPEFLDRFATKLYRSSSIKGLILILDQFEELFTQNKDDQLKQKFLQALKTCLSDRNLKLKVLVSLRADYYSKLNDVKSYLNRIFENAHELKPMNSKEISEAIVKPLEFSYPEIIFEEALLQQLLLDLKEKAIQLPMLQILCTEIFDNRGESKILQLSQYLRMNGARGILSSYLNSRISQMEPKNQETARELLRKLISINGTRELLSESEILKRVEFPDDQTRFVLNELIVTHRLVQPSSPSELAKYELSHDLLIAEINKWGGAKPPSGQELKLIHEVISKSYMMEDLILLCWFHFGISSEYFADRGGKSQFLLNLIVYSAHRDGELSRLIQYVLADFESGEFPKYELRKEERERYELLKGKFSQNFGGRKFLPLQSSPDEYFQQNNYELIFDKSQFAISENMIKEQLTILIENLYEKFSTVELEELCLYCFAENPEKNIGPDGDKYDWIFNILKIASVKFNGFQALFDYILKYRPDVEINSNHIWNLTRLSKYEAQFGLLRLKNDKPRRKILNDNWLNIKRAVTNSFTIGQLANLLFEINIDLDNLVHINTNSLYKIVDAAVNFIMVRPKDILPFFLNCLIENPRQDLKIAIFDFGLEVTAGSEAQNVELIDDIRYLFDRVINLKREAELTDVEPQIKPKTIFDVLLNAIAIYLPVDEKITQLFGTHQIEEIKLEILDYYSNNLVALYLLVNSIKKSLSQFSRGFVIAQNDLVESRLEDIFCQKFSA